MNYAIDVSLLDYLILDLDWENVRGKSVVLWWKRRLAVSSIDNDFSRREWRGKKKYLSFLY